MQLPFTSPVVSYIPFNIVKCAYSTYFQLYRKCCINRHYQCINNNIPWSSTWGSTPGTGHSDSVFLKVDAKSAKLFNKKSEVENVSLFSLFHCIFLKTASKLNTHLYLVFWLLPYQWDFYIKKELWHLWLHLVVVQPTAGKPHSFQITAAVANCLNRV